MVGSTLLGVKISKISISTKLIVKQIILNNDITYSHLYNLISSHKKKRNPKCGINLWLHSFSNLRARWWWKIKAMQWPSYPSKEIGFPFVQRLCCRLWSRCGKKVSSLEDFDATTFGYISIQIYIVQKSYMWSRNCKWGEFSQISKWIIQQIGSNITSYFPF
jgi:hypothetical protein